MSDETGSLDGQFIEFKCPYCGGDNAFPGYEAGAVQECPYCPGVFVVPLENGSPGLPIPIPITTPRLTLRRFKLGDNDDLAEFMGNEELSRYANGNPMDDAAINEWLERDQKSKILRPDEILWLGIVLKENDKLIGWARMDYLRPSFGPQLDQQARLFVVINPAFQRKGYALEVIQNLLAFGFGSINLRRITALCDSRDLPAKALLAKAGLRFEGEFFQERFAKDEWIDTSYFAMLAGEFEGGQQSQSRQV
jgi:[ribosomal protein S5]-alanine N-acetyltransferase